jgi:CheY-like chemotaxis protein
VVPRVLVVQQGPDVGDFDVEKADVETVRATDGDDALALAAREPFDAVLLDLRLPPLDGWCVLAALGTWPDAYRPRIITMVGDRGEILRARSLGADLCVTAGTNLHARALLRSTKERPCPQPRATSFPRPTTNGVPA